MSDGIPSPNPDFPQQIKNVTGQANIKIQNKNLWNNELEQGEYDTNGEKVSTFVWLVNKVKIPVKSNTKYTISQKERPSQYRIIYWNNGNYLSRENNTQNVTTGYSSFTFTTPENCNEIYIQFRSTLEKIATGTYEMKPNDISNIQLEQGSTATSYVPHQEQNYPLTLGDIELNKIPNTDIEDYFYKNNEKWYLHKEIAKAIFDGSESGWTIFPIGENKYQHFIAFSNVKHNTSKITIMSDYARGILIGNRADKGNNNTVFTYNGGIAFRFDEFTTTNDFKTWLSTHNTEVYYQLATPTNTEITDTTLIEQLEATLQARSYDDQTNISSTSDELAFIMDVESLRKIDN